MQLTFQQNSILEEIKEFLKGDCSVFILKGYAGTGKTTMIQHIYEYAKPLIDVRLMAPTGRAARVLTSKLPKSDEGIGVTASTIHRGIYSYSDIYSKMMKEQKDKFDDDLLLCYEISEHDDNVLVIIDEASMISSRKSDQEIFHFGSGNLLNDILTFLSCPLHGWNRGVLFLLHSLVSSKLYKLKLCLFYSVCSIFHNALRRRCDAFIIMGSQF